MLRVLLSCVLLISFAAAADQTDSIRRSLESHYQHTRTLKAAFFERYSDGNGGVSAESGMVYFSRPGRMRWEYQSPSQKLFIVDGTNVWFYVPEDHTASRAKLRESGDWRTPLSFLAGKAGLSKFCHSVALLAPETGAGAESLAPGHAVLRCIPRGDPRAAGMPKDALLESDGDSRLVRVVIHEAGNAETEFRFGNWQENIAIPESSFHFAPPPGVAVVDENSLSSQIH